MRCPWRRADAGARAAGSPARRHAFPPARTVRWSRGRHAGRSRAAGSTGSASAGRRGCRPGSRRHGPAVRYGAGAGRRGRPHRVVEERVVGRGQCGPSVGNSTAGTSARETAAPGGSRMADSGLSRTPRAAGERVRAATAPRREAAHGGAREPGAGRATAHPGAVWLRNAGLERARTGKGARWNGRQPRQRARPGAVHSALLTRSQDGREPPSGPRTVVRRAPRRRQAVRPPDVTLTCSPAGSVLCIRGTTCPVQDLDSGSGGLQALATAVVAAGDAVEV